MNYIDELAAAIRSHVSVDLIPEGDTSVLFRVYAVLALAKGEDVALRDVHDAWAAWIASTEPRHPSLRPFSDLPTAVRCSDQPYLDAIRTVARTRALAG